MSTIINYSPPRTLMNQGRSRCRLQYLLWNSSLREWVSFSLFLSPAIALAMGMNCLTTTTGVQPPCFPSSPSCLLELVGSFFLCLPELGEGEKVGIWQSNSERHRGQTWIEFTPNFSGRNLFWNCVRPTTTSICNHTKYKGAKMYSGFRVYLCNDTPMAYSLFIEY